MIYIHNQAHFARWTKHDVLSRMRMSHEPKYLDFEFIYWFLSCLIFSLKRYCMKLLTKNVFVKPHSQLSWLDNFVSTWWPHSWRHITRADWWFVFLLDDSYHFCTKKIFYGVQQVLIFSLFIMHTLTHFSPHSSCSRAPLALPILPCSHAPLTLLPHTHLTLLLPSWPHTPLTLILSLWWSPRDPPVPMLPSFFSSHAPPALVLRSSRTPPVPSAPLTLILTAFSSRCSYPHDPSCVCVCVRVCAWVRACACVCVCVCACVSDGPSGRDYVSVYAYVCV